MKIAVDVVRTHGLLDVCEVAPPELFERVELAWKVRGTVGDPVSKAGGTESAVATRRGPAQRFALEQEHVTARVALLRAQSGPQAGKSAANDHQVGTC